MNRHYIYVLLDPFENFEWEYENKKYYYKPFYVGIGVDKRINVHTSPSNLKK